MLTTHSYLFGQTTEAVNPSIRPSSREKSKNYGAVEGSIGGYESLLEQFQKYTQKHYFCSSPIRSHIPIIAELLHSIQLESHSYRKVIESLLSFRGSDLTYESFFRYPCQVIPHGKFSPRNFRASILSLLLPLLTSRLPIIRMTLRTRFDDPSRSPPGRCGQ